MAPSRGNKALALLGILLLAINLRPAITSVGPLISQIGSDLNLGASELGLLGALPVATFGVISPFVQMFIRRFGAERVTATAMLVLTVATVLRSWPGPNANLWIGTFLIGAAIAVGNVAVPIFVKRSFPAHTARITALYVSTLGICAGLSAALAVPIAELSTSGWRMALGIWALLTLVAVLYWLTNALKVKTITGGSSTPLTQPRVNLWRSANAWWLSAYMGVQSSVFYVSLTWLPTVEIHLGYNAVTAGWHMFALQVAGVVGNLLAPSFMKIGADERFAAVLPGLFFVISLTGLYLAPTLALLWVSILGLGTGSAFVVSLSLMATRASTITTAGALSAMTQGMGYALAAVILFIAGAIAGENILGVLLVLGIAGISVSAIGLLTGRARMVDS